MRDQEISSRKWGTRKARKNQGNYQDFQLKISFNWDLFRNISTNKVVSFLTISKLSTFLLQVGVRWKRVLDLKHPFLIKHPFSSISKMHWIILEWSLNNIFFLKSRIYWRHDSSELDNAWIDFAKSSFVPSFSDPTITNFKRSSLHQASLKLIQLTID